MALDIIETTTAELMGYLTYESVKREMEVDDLLDELVAFLAHYQERKRE